MRTMYVVLLLGALVGILATAVSCNTLALGGAKKYRVDITVAVNGIDDELNSSGKVSDKALAKLQKVLDTYQTEFANSGTYKDGQEIINLINQARADAATEFATYQQVKQKIASIRDMIRTEVPD